jgi:hypothetical protein
MMHFMDIDKMHVDHFNPNLKTDYHQPYDNLMPSLPACNQTKGYTWPTKADQECGIHLIDPTQEKDYGHQIFEDPESHKLVGTTPAGKYHIRVLGLNSPFLIDKRRIRAELRALLNQPQKWIEDVAKDSPTEAATLKEIADRMIPDIPPPPQPPPQLSSGSDDVKAAA